MWPRIRLIKNFGLRLWSIRFELVALGILGYVHSLTMALYLTLCSATQRIDYRVKIYHQHPQCPILCYWTSCTYFMCSPILSFSCLYNSGIIKIFKVPLFLVKKSIGTLPMTTIKQVQRGDLGTALSQTNPVYSMSVLFACTYALLHPLN